MRLFTIGFTQRSAEAFFTCLQQAGVRRIVDIRLNNTSQLAGFAKARDLEYLLRAICDIAYIHLPEFAPTADILDAYKKNKGRWDVYEQEFLSLINTRRIENTAQQLLQDGDCLLCSEPTADQCHRRLTAEYLQQHLDALEIRHL